MELLLDPHMMMYSSPPSIDVTHGIIIRQKSQHLSRKPELDMMINVHDQ